MSMDSKTTTCAKCGSEKVIPDLPFHGGDGQTFVSFIPRPQAFPLFRGWKWLYVTTNLCCACGHVELRCPDDLTEVWKLYTEQVRAKKEQAKKEG